MAPKFFSFVNNILTLIKSISSTTGTNDAFKLISTGADGLIDPSFLNSAGIITKTKAEIDALILAQTISAGSYYFISDRNIYIRALTINEFETNGYFVFTNQSLQREFNYIEYDIINDWVNYREDRRGNKIRYDYTAEQVFANGFNNIDNFTWGDDRYTSFVAINPLIINISSFSYDNIQNVSIGYGAEFSNITASALYDIVIGTEATFTGITANDIRQINLGDSANVDTVIVQTLRFLTVGKAGILLNLNAPTVDIYQYRIGENQAVNNPEATASQNSTNVFIEETQSNYEYNVVLSEIQAGNPDGFSSLILSSATLNYVGILNVNFITAEISRIQTIQNPLREFKFKVNGPVGTWKFRTIANGLPTTVSDQIQAASSMLITHRYGILTMRKTNQVRIMQQDIQ